MNRAQIVDLLTFCAANDQRTVGQSDVAVWFDMLEPIDFDRALDAARQHYRREPDKRMTPGRIWVLCKTVTEAERLERDLAAPCEHGVLCRACKLVHQPDAYCDALTSHPVGLTAIPDQFRALVGTLGQEIPE